MSRPPTVTHLYINSCVTTMSPMSEAPCWIMSQHKPMFYIPVQSDSLRKYRRPHRGWFNASAFAITELITPSAGLMSSALMLEARQQQRPNQADTISTATAQ